MKAKNNKKRAKTESNPNGAGRLWFDGKDEKEVLSKLEQAWAIGCPDVEAITHAEISQASLARYYDAHEGLRERRDALKQRPFFRARKAIVESLDDPNQAFRYMEKKRPEEFKSITQAVSVNVQNEPLNPELQASINQAILYALPEERATAKARSTPKKNK